MYAASGSTVILWWDFSELTPTLSWPGEGAIHPDRG
jgi:hypothetical protein